jgi:hypothetical protein
MHNDTEYEHGGNAVDTSYNSTDDTAESFPKCGSFGDVVAAPTVLLTRTRQRSDAPSGCAVVNASSTQITLPCGWTVASEPPAAVRGSNKEQKAFVKERVLVMMTASGTIDSGSQALVWREYTVTKYHRAGMGVTTVAGAQNMLWVITAVEDTSIQHAIDLRQKHHDGINGSKPVQHGSWMHMVKQT